MHRRSSSSAAAAAATATRRRRAVAVGGGDVGGAGDAEEAGVDGLLVEDPAQGEAFLLDLLQMLTTKILPNRDDSPFYKPPICSAYGLEVGADQLSARMAQDSKV